MDTTERLTLETAASIAVPGANWIAFLFHHRVRLVGRFPDKAIAGAWLADFGLGLNPIYVAGSAARSIAYRWIEGTVAK